MKIERLAPTSALVGPMLQYLWKHPIAIHKGEREGKGVTRDRAKYRLCDILKSCQAGAHRWYIVLYIGALLQRVAFLVTVQASSLPMSIIIIGIGNAEFDGNSGQYLFYSKYHDISATI